MQPHPSEQEASSDAYRVHRHLCVTRHHQLGIRCKDTAPDFTNHT